MIHFLALLLGLALLVFGAELTIRGACSFSLRVGLSPVIVGLTIVAVGTSLPELATAVVAALRNEADIAVGNIVGSNIFNIAAILGITSMVTPIAVSSDILTRELPAVLVLSLIVLPLTKSGLRVHRWEGAVLLASYLALTTWLVAF